MNKSIGKRGEVQDILIFIITIFVLAIGLISLMYVIPALSNGLRVGGLNNSAEGSAAIDSLEIITMENIDNGFLMLFIGLGIGLIISSFLVRTHPIFLLFYIFILAITLLLGFYLGNTYSDFAANPTFADIQDESTFINLLMNNIVEITLGLGIMSIIIVFAKFSSFGGSQQL